MAPPAHVHQVALVMHAVDGVPLAIEPASWDDVMDLIAFAATYLTPIIITFSDVVPQRLGVLSLFAPGAKRRPLHLRLALQLCTLHR